ncbi:MAG TPA: hypothetical protein PL082_07500 [Tepidiformaceae bacterium]|nr:hypothetical protein [Tepidiformaceae bacterium]
MSEQISLTADAERAVREAENLCWRTNVAIIAPEHLLAGCLRVLGAVGVPGIPGVEAIEQAVVLSQGSGETVLKQDVRFGSAARDALAYAGRLALDAGRDEIDTFVLTVGLLYSGEVGPSFFAALGIQKDALMELLGGE